MLFSPPLKTFSASLVTMIEAMITNVQTVPRLLYMRPFKP